MSDQTGERVLVVEDDPATRLGLTELVRTWGYLAAAAEDGEDALRQISEFRPSIVITDLVMPRMGGIDLLRAITAMGPGITVVASDGARHGRDGRRGDEGGRL